MRLFLLFPLAYLSGVDGFTFFMPYMLLILIVGFSVRRLRMRRIQALNNVANCAALNARHEDPGTLALALVALVD